MDEFKVGDVVYLNSGSPALTVTEVYENSTVEVSWMDIGFECQVADFPVACLTRTKTPLVNPTNE